MLQSDVTDLCYWYRTRIGGKCKLGYPRQVSHVLHCLMACQQCVAMPYGVSAMCCNALSVLLHVMVAQHPLVSVQQTYILLHKFCSSAWISVNFMLVCFIKSKCGIGHLSYEARCLPITVSDDMQSCQPLQQ